MSRRESKNQVLNSNQFLPAAVLQLKTQILVTGTVVVAMYVNMPLLIVQASSPVVNSFSTNRLPNVIPIVAVEFKEVLLSSLVSAYSSETFDNDSDVRAFDSIVDALVATSSLNLKRQPSAIIISDEGFLTLQWVKGDRGLLLVFSGDREATYSVRLPNARYSDNVCEFKLSDIPQQLRNELDLIEAA